MLDSGGIRWENIENIGNLELLLAGGGKWVWGFFGYSSKQMFWGFLMAVVNSIIPAVVHAKAAPPYLSLLYHPTSQEN